MANKVKSKEWFLVKKSWKEWLLTLTDEQAGQVFKALYTEELPDGLIGTLIKSHMEEFKRVNDYTVKNAEERSKKAAESANARWSKQKETDKERMQSYTNVLNNLTNASNTDTVAPERNANIDTDIDTDIDTGIDKGIDKGIDSYINGLVDKEDISEEELMVIPDKMLSKALIERKSNLIFQ